MSIGKNIFFLRKQRKITQEELAERMAVSRQTISKWESDDAVPELGKLVELCDFFSCKLDAVVREDLTANSAIYSEVRLETVKGFSMARYVMITPNCEDDVIKYMDSWAMNEGLLTDGASAKRIGWDFPFVSMEQQNRFGLRGYVAAYILPDGFEPKHGGAEIAKQQEAVYAVITIREPFIAPFERIPGAYKAILDYLQANGFKDKIDEDVLPCFEYEYKKDDITYMDVFIHADAVAKGNFYSNF